MAIVEQFFKNNVEVALGATLSNSATSVTLATGGGDHFALPSGKHIIATISEGAALEIVKVTARTGDSLTLERGQEGTAGQAFTTSAKISIRLTANFLNALIAYLAELPEPVGPEVWGSLASLTYASKTLDISANVTGPWCFRFNTAGTLLIVSNGENLYSYTLSTAWDISTATYTASAVIPSVDWAGGFCFSSDGLRMFINNQGSSVRIKAYSLSSPFDISTLSYVAQSDVITGSGAGSNPVDIYVSDDGLAFYVLGEGSQSIFRLNASTAWDLTTLNETPANLYWFDLIKLYNFAMHPDLNQFLITESNNAYTPTENGFNVKNVTITDGNLSTASITATALQTQSPTTDYYGVVVGNNGANVYLLRGTDLYQYSWS